jgi:threonylcarbamoyladenosine tRNA methylthiotransferase MtaB
MPRQQVLEQVGLLNEKGFKEIVLTGINLGSWGRDTGEGPLAELLATLTESAPKAFGQEGFVRYRLSSIEPLEVDSRLLDVMELAGEAVAHHFHLPLQSGSSTVLRRMRRPYRPAGYRAVIDDVVTRFPDAALGADVIVGFPGETEAEFEETMAFVEESPLSYLHVFSYSDRQGTPASSMSGKVRSDIIHERSLRLRTLGERKTSEFFQKALGSLEVALVLKERDRDGLLQGVTGNYAEVLLPGDDSLMNTFVRVVLEERRSDGRWLVSLTGRVPKP